MNVQQQHNVLTTNSYIITLYILMWIEMEQMDSCNNSKLQQEQHGNGHCAIVILIRQFLKTNL